jgi:hypothetical protein
MYSCVNTKLEDATGNTFKNRKLRPREKLLLISHDCDIASPSYPYVEALVCKPHDVLTSKGAKQLAKVGPDDPRSFIVSKELGLVADSTHRVLLEKTLLLDIPEPDFCIGDGIEALRFRDWLAKRYARAANDDRTHNLVIGPLAETVLHMQQSDPHAFFHIDQVVHQVRVRIMDERKSPIKVGILMILKDLGDKITDEHIDGINRLSDALIGYLQAHDDVTFIGESRQLYEEVRFVEMQRTRALSTERASYDEALNITGAAPPALLAGDSEIGV